MGKWLGSFLTLENKIICQVTGTWFSEVMFFILISDEHESCFKMPTNVGNFDENQLTLPVALSKKLASYACILILRPFQISCPCRLVS